MTSKLIVNTIEADTGISSVSFASSISMDSTSKFHFSAAGIDIGADTNINRPAAGVIGFNVNGAEKLRIDTNGHLNTSGIATASNFKTGSSNLHSTGLTVGNNFIHTTGINVGTGATIHVPSSNVLTFGTNSNERLRITSAGSVGIGTVNPLTRLHIADTNTTVWPFVSAVGSTYAYTPYPHELVIDNDVKGTEGSFAGIYFNAGSDTDGSKVSTARIAAVDTGSYKADLVFSNRGSGGSSHKENLRIKSDGNITAVGIVTAKNFNPTDVQLSHRNRIINGDMQVSQRVGTTETTITNGTLHYILDRFAHYESTSGSATVTQVTSGYAASHNGSGKAMRIKTTGADTSLGGSAQLMFFQYIEGHNWEDLRFGTANAKSFTVSFSILASGASAGNVTGTYCVNATNAPNFDRTYVKEYTIDAVDTWKRVSLTFPGDTSGSWGTGNGAAIRIGWSFAGPNSQEGSADTWHSSYKGSTSNQKNGMANVNNFYFITDIQVEEGTVATPFEHHSFGEELALCQRYYQKYRHATYRGLNFIGRKTGSNTVVGAAYGFPPMRTAATGTINGGGSYRLFRFTDSATHTPSSVTFTHENYEPYNVLKFTAACTTYSTGHFIALGFTTGSAGTLQLDAEL